MCGRFDFHGSSADVVRAFAGVLADGPPAPPRYNLPPTALAWTVAAHPDGAARTVAARHFGLARRQGSGLLLNARCETIAQLPTFRGALAARRCVVPAHGFYEWDRATRPRQPHYFSAPDGRLLPLAGLFYPPPRDSPAGTAGSFVIVTCAANPVVAPLHARMPAILTADAVHAWLADARAAPDCLRPLAATGLRAWPVDVAVNRAGHDGPGCIAAL